MRAAGRGLRAGRIVGRLFRDVDDGIGDITYRGGELSIEFSLPRLRRRGSGKRGCPECAELDEGYAPVVSAVHSTGLSYCGSPRMLFVHCKAIYSPIASKRASRQPIRQW